MSKMLTVAQLSKELGIHPQTIYRWKRRGEIHSSVDKKTGRIVFALDQVAVAKEAVKHGGKLRRDVRGMITVRQAADLLGVSVQTVYGYRAQGLIEGFYAKKSRVTKLFFHQKDVEALVNANEENALAPKQKPHLRPMRIHLLDSQIEHVKRFGSERVAKDTSLSFAQSLRAVIDDHANMVHSNALSINEEPEPDTLVHNEVSDATPPVSKKSGIFSWIFG